MSPLSRCVLLFSLTFTGLFAEEKSLNDHLEDRVVLNAKYAKRFVEEAEESPYAKRLQPIEKELGSEWVGLLKKVKSSDDDQLKMMVLRIEILDEIRACYYDLEWAESMAEKVKLRNQLAQWKKLLVVIKAISTKPVSGK